MFCDTTVNLLHALHHLVDVLSHDVLDVNQAFVDLSVAVRAGSLLVVLLALHLDFTIYVSPRKTRSTEASVGVRARHGCQSRSPAMGDEKGMKRLFLVLILEIGNERVLDVLQIGEDDALRHVLFRQCQEAHVLIDNVARP